ncbi:flagellar basal-body rod protein FlgG [Enterobacter hormaechei subsp. steigerwaltii]|uniref:flagellar basal-body rod protein FlgG n=1 Tax=Enterobacter hormaechei TaxID=158836 RepID=UPI0035C62211
MDRRHLWRRQIDIDAPDAGRLADVALRIRRSDRKVMRSFPEGGFRGKCPGAGTGVRPVSTQRVHTQGGLNMTGNDTDVAIEGKGFFQVQLPDGSTAYTRDGHFDKNENGQLVNAEGHPILPGVVVPQDAKEMQISPDGIVSVTLPGQAQPQQVGQLTLATFVNDAGLESIGGNLYRETQSSGAPNELNPGLEDAGTLKQKYIETSNVNVAEELVNMIQVQRAYEINSKAVSASDQMLQRLTQL